MSEQPPATSELYEAAVAGDLDRFNRLLAADNTLNVYETDENDVTMLANVLRYEQESVASLLLDIWESDIAFIKSQLDPLNCAALPMHDVLVACGPQLCTTIESYVSDEMLVTSSLPSDAGLIILLKHTGFRGKQQRVLNIRPVDADLLYTSRALAKIVELVYTSRGGGLMAFVAYTAGLTLYDGSLYKQLCPFSLFEFASSRRTRVSYLRLQKLMNYYNNIPESFECLIWAHACILSIGSDIPTDMDTVWTRMLEITSNKSPKVQRPELELTPKDWPVLNAILELNNSSRLFDNMLQKMSGTDTGRTLEYFLQRTEKTYYVAGRKSPIRFGHFLYKWFQYGQQAFLLPHLMYGGPGQLLVLQGLLADDNGAPDLLRYILSSLSPRLSQIRGAIPAVYLQLCQTRQHQLIRSWLPKETGLIKECYDWNGSSTVYKTIVDLVRTDRDADHQMAAFLVDLFAAEMTTEFIGLLLQRLAMYEGSEECVAKLVKLSKCPPIVANWFEETGRSDRSPVFNAIMMNNWDIVVVLFNADRKCISYHPDDKEYNGESILAACIASRSPKQQHFKYARIPTPAAEPTGKQDVYVPSHLDEMLNGYEFRPAEDVVEATIDPEICVDLPEDLCEPPPLILNEIFDDLIDHGFPVDVINDSGQSLLHLAAIFDNSTAVQNLIDNCHVDVELRDAKGNLALHYARSAAVFEHLLVATGDKIEQPMLQRNHRGHTPLMAACFEFNEDPQPKRHVRHLLDKMHACCLAARIAAPIYPMEAPTDHPLYMARTGYMTRWLLQRGGADINAANSAGETCMHYYQQRRIQYWKQRCDKTLAGRPEQPNLDVLRAMLADDRLDLLAVTKAGQSHLELIAGLTQAEYEHVEAQLDRLQPKLEQLFARHCNWRTRIMGDLPLLFQTMQTNSNAYARRSMLMQRDQLQLTSTLLIGCGTSVATLEAAWQMMGSRMSRAVREAAVTTRVLTLALGNTGEELTPNVAALQWLLEKRPLSAIVAAAPQAWKPLLHLDGVLRKLQQIGNRKAVIGAAAALVAAGDDYRGLEKMMQTTVLRHLFPAAAALKTDEIVDTNSNSDSVSQTESDRSRGPSQCPGQGSATS